jgi:hypothetical protein
MFISPVVTTSNLTRVYNIRLCLFLVQNITVVFFGTLALYVGGLNLGLILFSG